MGGNPPTEPGRVAESVTISGSRSLTQGEATTLVATVRWSTGASESVTEGVAWVSDDPRTASVDQRGVVIAVAPGESRIRATVNTVSGTTLLTIVAGSQTFHGIVHESLPTEQQTIAGATVTGVDAAGTTQAVITDGSGRFTLRLVPGIARITVAAPGYETAKTSADLTVTELSLALAPELREVRESFDYILPTYPPSSAVINQRSYRISVHHAGELRAGYTVSWAGASAQAHTCLEVRGANSRLLDRSHGTYDNAATPIRLDVSPGVYEVKFSSCNPYGPEPIQDLAAFGGEIKHPS